MNRLTMPNRAIQSAHELVDESAALSDEEHKTLSELGEKVAVAQLAQEIIDEAYGSSEEYFQIE